MYSKLATTTTALTWQQHAANAPRVKRAPAIRPDNCLALRHSILRRHERFLLWGQARRDSDKDCGLYHTLTTLQKSNLWTHHNYVCTLVYV